MIRVKLPAHLRTLAGVDGELVLEVREPITIDRIIDVIEDQFPQLTGTIRDRGTRRRRAFVRFYACEEDWSNSPTDQPLPDEIADGRTPLLIVGAMAGG
jgi:molybdopterin converting factor small subunit